jgi:hypothetical protein
MNATLSQVASKAAELWIQGAKKPGACGQFFDIYDLYRGTSFNRNFSSKGVTKEAKAFNEAEFYLANLLYDYFANRDSKNASINVMAAVISDKNKLIKVKFALNKNIKGYNKPLIEFSESELKSWISDRLGTFYRTMYNNIKSEFKILQSVSKEVFGEEIPINLETDFAEFNEFCKDKNLDSDIVLHELVYAA